LLGKKPLRERTQEHQTWKVIYMLSKYRYLYLPHIIGIFGPCLCICNTYIFVFAIHIKPKNQDFRCLITDVRVLGHPKIKVLGPKWVAVNSNGLKLWENDATGLNIIIK
jgi:hypothetical protein